MADRVEILPRPTYSSRVLYLARVTCEQTGESRDCYHSHSTQALAEKCAEQMLIELARYRATRHD